VGDDLEAAIDAQKQKQVYFTALRANVSVVQKEQDAGRLKVTDAVYHRPHALQHLRQVEQLLADAGHLSCEQDSCGNQSASASRLLDMKRKAAKFAIDPPGMPSGRCSRKNRELSTRRVRIH
jgi:hypothetical protein